MEWMTPMTAVIAAAAAVPSLVLLYFLKLKRREVPVSSTLLWKRAANDLQVNAPFQRLRRNILLLLQLLALAAVLVALAGPVLSLRAGPGRRFVLLIDRSASMNAVDAGGKSRLDRARERAKAVIESLRRPSPLAWNQAGDEAMVVAFDRRARVMCGFTSDKTRLAAAVEAVEPTDAVGSIAEAIKVARAFAQSAGTDENNRSSAGPASIELFSDGKITDLGEIDAVPGELVFHRVGSSSENVAITAMQARRSYDRADEVYVFATLSNFGRSPVTCDVQLSIDGAIRAVRRVSIPPAGSAGPAGGAAGGAGASGDGAAGRCGRAS
ncbi:MAG: VWA domain-containing protein, partial [Planctomycetes bacterium]|nr:VWA domain-containing protein [Planctomycetota bacterium]